jgi:hypothetical protein
MGGRQWMRNVLLTAFLLPSVLLLSYFIVSCVLWAKSSSAGVGIGVWFILLLLLFLNAGLVAAGSYGKKENSYLPFFFFFLSLSFFLFSSFFPFSFSLSPSFSFFLLSLPSVLSSILNLFSYISVLSHRSTHSLFQLVSVLLLPTRPFRQISYRVSFPTKFGI